MGVLGGYQRPSSGILGSPQEPVGILGGRMSPELLAALNAESGVGMTNPDTLGQANAVLPSNEWVQSMTGGPPMQGTPEWLTGFANASNYGMLAGGPMVGMVKPAGRMFDLSNPGYRTAKIGHTEVSYAVGKDGSAEVAMVKTPKELRGQGSARAAMEQLISEADAQGLRLKLSADPMDNDTKKSGLVTFYKSLGFKRNAGRDRDFTTRAEYIREPR